MSLHDVKTGKNVGEKASTKKEAKKILKKMVASKMGHKGGFIERLEKHKAEGASFDNGTWKPKKKGESFIDALERHKSSDMYY